MDWTASTAEKRMSRREIVVGSAREREWVAVAGADGGGGSHADDRKLKLGKLS